MVDRVWQYAGTFIVTVAGWLLWCIFTRDSFVPTVEVVALFIGALAFDRLAEHPTVRIGDRACTDIVFE